ncbi:MAG: metallophosphoesterase family protein [Bacillota bacterium]
MRVLHTADWHFGRSLESRSRQEEHERFVDELCAIVRDEAIDLVLVAGDIFDTVNPSAAAEELYCDALARLGENGKRGVVVIAGNHDSPDRLSAVRPLAQRHGATLLGYPYDDPGCYGSDPQRVRRVAAGPGWAEIALPGVDHSAVVLALPYPSESRLKQLLADSLGEEELQRSYSDQVRRWFEVASQHYRPETVRLAMSHIYVAGGAESVESERPIQMGGAYTVTPQAMPAAAQYVALGHLHRAQQVHSAPSLTRYAGSPIAFSFSEANYAKTVTILDLQPADERAAVRAVELSAGRPLVRWQATEGIAQVERWVAEGKDPTAWIDLEIHVQTPLTLDQVHRLRQMRAEFIHIRPVIATAEAELALTTERQALSLQEQFTRFFQANRGGTPSDELVRLFLELAADEDEEVEA